LHKFRDVDQLLELSDLPLVEALYARLLRRKAEPEELEFYVRRLRSGYGKNQLIVDFAALPEAIAKGHALAGLQQYVARQRRHRHSFWRLLGRGRQYESQLNRLENNLGRVLQELDTMQQETLRRLDAIENQLNLTPADDTPRPVAGSTANPDGVDLSDVSVAARRIFRELTQEIESANSQDPM
jgi:Domain of unknown function (DUF4214)